jgi:hypothetical protein
MKQNLYASTFEIIKATFWPQFWRFGKVDDVYVDLISCCRRWSFNKHWFESFHFVFNSSQVHQCTQYERLLKSFAFAIFHQNILSTNQKSSSIFTLKAHPKCMILCKLLVLCNFDKGTKGMELLLCNSI